MNPKRLILSIIAVFIGIFLTDFVIHGLWLKADYDATKELWRTEEDMGRHFHWLLLGQFVIAVIFSTIWAKSFAHDADVRAAAVYGALMGAFLHSTSLINHAVSPLPSHIMAKWTVSGIVQMSLIGMLLYAVYKPLPRVAPAS